MKNIITIETARANGLKRYFTGIPCKNGHISERQTKGSVCIACFNKIQNKCAEKRRRKAGAKPMGIKTKARALAIKNGETRFWSEKPCPHEHIGWRSTKSYNCLECKRLSRLVPEDKKIKRRTPEEAKQLRKEYEKEKLSRRRAKKNGRHTMAQIREMHKKQEYKCKNCLTCINDYYERDHIMPIALGGSDNIDNIQLLCKPCNNRKGAMHPDEWNKVR